jgi:hypothetical protein
MSADTITEATVLLEQLRRSRAADAAATLARAYGYANVTVIQLAREAKRAWVEGETPEQTAARVVRRPNEPIH